MIHSEDVMSLEMRSSVAVLRPYFFSENNLCQEGRAIFISLKLSVIEELCVHLLIDWET